MGSITVLSEKIRDFLLRNKIQTFYQQELETAEDLVLVIRQDRPSTMAEQVSAGAVDKMFTEVCVWCECGILHQLRFRGTSRSRVSPGLRMPFKDMYMQLLVLLKNQNLCFVFFSGHSEDHRASGQMRMAFAELCSRHIWEACRGSILGSEHAILKS